MSKPQDFGIWVRAMCLNCETITQVLTDYPDSSANGFCLPCLDASCESADVLEGLRKAASELNILCDGSRER